MGGSNTTEQLDRIVERIEKKGQSKQPPKATAQSKPKGQPPEPKQQPRASSKPAQKAARQRKKELTPEKLAHARKFQENRRRAGQATAYYGAVIQQKTPMIFRCYGGMNLPCAISRDGGDTFTILVNKRRQVVWKTRLQYGYEARNQREVEQAISVDEQVKGQKLTPILPQAERYQIPDAELLFCKEDGHPLRLTMRGGEVIEGRVEWFGAFDIKVELSGRRSVVVFRHAVYAHEVLPKG